MHELAPSGAHVPEADPEFGIEGEADDARQPTIDVVAVTKHLICFA